MRGLQHARATTPSRFELRREGLDVVGRAGHDAGVRAVLGGQRQRRRQQRLAASRPPTAAPTASRPAAAPASARRAARPAAPRPPATSRRPAPRRRTRRRCGRSSPPAARRAPARSAPARTRGRTSPAGSTPVARAASCVAAEHARAQVEAARAGCSASAHSSKACAERRHRRAYSSRPMPAYCAPWPGNSQTSGGLAAPARRGSCARAPSGASQRRDRLGADLGATTQARCGKAAAPDAQRVRDVGEVELADAASRCVGRVARPSRPARPACAPTAAAAAARLGGGRRRAAAPLPARRARWCRRRRSELTPARRGCRAARPGRQARR